MKNNEESLRIRVKTLPKIHPDIATAYNGMAMYAQKAVDIDMQALPADHPQTLQHKRNLEILKQSNQDAQ